MLVKRVIPAFVLMVAAVNMHAAVNRAMSVQTLVNGSATSVPVLTVGGDDTMTVSFDLDEPDMRYLTASVTALTPVGTPSRMTPDEFLDTFNRADVTEVDFSQATVSHYTNYRFTLSADNLLPTKSGLFRLDFVDSDQPSDTLLSLPFYVVSNRATIAHTLSSITDVSYNEGKRQLALDCNLAGRFPMLTPDNLSLTVLIDGRIAADGIHPSQITGNRVVFSHIKPLIFDNGNNWRRFDMTDSDYRGHGVAQIETTPDGHRRFILNRDTPRAGLPYETDGALFGNFVIANTMMPSSPDTGSEYCDVVFSLDMPFMPLEAVAVEGDFTRLMPGGALPMSFNSFTGLYETTARLKQGVYNYRYVTGNPPSSSSIEGNFNETPARYDILLFYSSPAMRYPELIGHKTFTCQI